MKKKDQISRMFHNTIMELLNDNLRLCKSSKTLFQCLTDYTRTTQYATEWNAFRMRQTRDRRRKYAANPPEVALSLQQINALQNTNNFTKLDSVQLTVFKLQLTLVQSYLKERSERSGLSDAEKIRLFRASIITLVRAGIKAHHTSAYLHTAIGTLKKSDDQYALQWQKFRASMADRNIDLQKSAPGSCVLTVQQVRALVTKNSFTGMRFKTLLVFKFQLKSLLGTL